MYLLSFNNRKSIFSIHFFYIFLKIKTNTEFSVFLENLLD